jgi:predicted transposase/invertase (TIGR01784 family)
LKHFTGYAIIVLWGWRKLQSESENKTLTNEELNVPHVNRKIKDGLFRLIFARPENAAELYYALTGTECRPDEIEIITLTTTISGKLKNDLAFIVKDKVMVVLEHQATPNENMPVRLLMYIGQLYEMLFSKKKEAKLVYGNKLYKIPKPEFAVFYNGIADRPEKEVLRLSDAFEEAPDSGLGSLELEVPVYNINKTKNTELLDGSEKLKHYSEFVAKLKELQKIYDNYKQAVRQTLSYCMDNGILAEFLREHGGAIMSILFTEYDEEVAKRVYAEERVEDERIELAKEMLMDNEPIEKIARYTKLPIEVIHDLQIQLQQ